MSLEKLGKYRINKAYTEGVIINLDGAPEVSFLVKLPGQYNRAYMAAMYGSIEFEMSESGEAKAKTNVLEARSLQEEAFVEHCLVSIDGEPVPENFINEYSPALEELQAKANDLVEQIQEGVDEATKKSAPTLIGKEGGVIG